VPIEEIPEITVPTIWTEIPFVPVPQPSKILALPVVNMPCALGRKDFTPNREIYTDDPEGTLVLCPGIPSFEPIQYNKKELKIITIQKPQIAPPPENTASAPEATPPPTEDLKEDIPCPDPSKNNPRIGDVAASGKEKVSGFELRDGTCVITYSSVTAIETYLPQVGTVSTTAVIASTAVISSVLAKPIADLLLKVIKPSIKKVIDGLKKKILKKEPEKVSGFERRMAQRERNRAFRKLKKGW
jgi:hypothetical protein